MSRALSKPLDLRGLLVGDALLGATPASALTWFKQLRAQAVERVGVLTVPTIRDEDWRFTDVSPIAKLSFQPARNTPGQTLADIAGFMLPEVAARLVFVDGVYAPQLSRNDSAIVVANLADAVLAHASEIEAQLARHADFQDSVFSALNTAFLHDGAVVLIPRGVRLEKPVHVLYLATREAAASYPRCLLIAGAGSAATLIEDYRSLSEVAYLTNAVTEMALAQDAHIKHVRVQRESGVAFHIGQCVVSAAKAGRYESVSIAQGARISRYGLNVQLCAGAECTADGLALIDGEQLADTHTTIDHAAPDGRSRQLHKCIVGGTAHAVFNGKIMVRRGAQHTDSAQASRNLLLSPRARIDTKPQLEIFADDVKCAHGATVGQLDADEVFYLRSRGLSEQAARDLLTFAFGAEVIERIPVAALREQLKAQALAYTHH